MAFMSKIEHWFASAFTWLGHYFWISQIIFATIFFFICYKLLAILLRKFQVRFRARHKWVIDVLIRAIKKPLRFLFFAVCILTICSIVNTNTALFSWFAIGKSRSIVIMIFIAWSLIYFVNNVQDHLLYSHSYDKTSILAFSQIAVAIIVAISSLSILQVMGVHIAGLLAFGGFSGIAVGFAAKDMLANFFGALMVYMDKPFKVGDWIRSPEKEIEGEVESIGWRQTKIMTFEKRPLYVPNALFSTIIVENPSRMTHRRFNEVIGIRYSDIPKANDIVLDIKKMLYSHQTVDSLQSIVVGVAKFSSSSVDLTVYCFTKTLTFADFSKVKQEILLGCAEIIAKHGAEIAFPTTTLHRASNQSSDDAT